MKVPYVDFARQYSGEKTRLIAALDRTLSQGEYILGREVESFEKNLAKLCHTKHAIGVANGTDALVLILSALGIGAGDEVITAPNSFIASAAAIALAGAKPVFADVGPDQLIDPAAVEKALSPRTKAVMPVHLTGKCCDMAPFLKLAKKKDLFLIEDAAQAVGAEYRDRRAGSLGDAASFSFHPLKNLNAAGDAGAITTDSDALAAKLRLLRNHGLVSRNEVAFWGHNSRLDAVQAAILNFRLKTLPKVAAARRRNAALYRKGLAGTVDCPSDEPGCRDVYHLFVIQCDRRDELQAYLQENGVSTAVHYPVPIHLQAPCAKLGYKAGDFPQAERQSGRILSLPVHQNLNEKQVRFVVEKIRTFYGKD
ncbi:MAG: DegT/DnrJ/EryC1/StrS family aminotransferase [Elusimicrobia bacterium]|nr:DegT/DnrJ/EryC1/StrS family aminotransferase [Elusimicrobiota bacterium]